MSNSQTRSLQTSQGLISYTLIRTARRRTIEISVPADASARVRAPAFVSLQTIEKFIHSRSGWILTKILEQKKVESLRASRRYESGHQFLFLGQRYPLVVEPLISSRPSISFDANAWQIRVPLQNASGEARKLLVHWYREQAKEVLGARVFHWSRVMGLAPQRITVKTQKRLWGSCNHHGRSINLNWMLVMTPLMVIDYVVVHELCHLLVPNHSRRFWKHVAQYFPDYQASEKWLKTHAPEMQLP